MSGEWTGSEAGDEMKRIILLLLVLSTGFVVSSCSPVHLYLGYHGRVLEEGTDKPIEGAGVLAGYYMRDHFPPDSDSRYIGYYATLTDKEGKFRIPPKLSFNLVPLATFDWDVPITIYKRGYANFSGGFHMRAKRGRSDPPVGGWLPAETDLTFWFPKLESEAEIEEHDKVFTFLAGEILHDKSFPPPGTRKIQFLPPKETGEWK